MLSYCRECCGFLLKIVEKCAVIRWLCEGRVNLTLKTKNNQIIATPAKTHVLCAVEKARYFGIFLKKESN